PIVFFAQKEPGTTTLARLEFRAPAHEAGGLFRPRQCPAGDSSVEFSPGAQADLGKKHTERARPRTDAAVSFNPQCISHAIHLGGLRLDLSIEFAHIGRVLNLFADARSFHAVPPNGDPVR